MIKLKKKCLLDTIKTLDYRINILEKYRNIDIDKEILDCINLKNKYTIMLKEMVSDE